MLVGRMEYSRGPLPPPETLAGYTELYPEAPAAFFDAMKSEREHRHRMDKADMDTDRHMLFRGQFFAMATVVLLAGLAGLALWKDSPWPAVAGISAIAIVIAANVLKYPGLARHEKDG